MSTKIWTTLFLMILSIKCSRAMIFNTGMTLTSSNNSPTVGSSVSLTCEAPGFDEFVWSGPSGVSIIFAPGCFRLTEAQSTHITYISASCVSGTSVLTINNFDPGRDAGSWTCSGISSVGQSGHAFITLTAAASNVENIKITTSGIGFIDYYDTLTLLYGEKETISCSADCPNGCQFTWHLNNQVVSSSNELIIDLQSTTPSPGGSYMCTASSGGDSLTKNLTINRWGRDTIIFMPPDDILNVNEGDDVTVTCDGETNSHYCTSSMGFVCSSNFYFGPVLNLYNINLNEAGRYYCIHDEYEQSSNTRINIYRSVQINVIANPNPPQLQPLAMAQPTTTGQASSTAAETTVSAMAQPTTTGQASSTAAATIASAMGQPTTTAQASSTAAATIASAMGQPTTTAQVSSTSTTIPAAAAAAKTTTTLAATTTTEQPTTTTQGISLTSTDNSPAIGSSVTLTCQTPGYHEITWSGPSGVYIIFAPTCFRLSEAESTHITYLSVSCGGGTSVLTINNFDPGRDAGGWSCSGNSMFGQSDSASITLISVAPNVKNIKITTELAFIDYSNRISLLYGEKETISCSADCQNGCQFTWYLDNQVVSSSNELVIDLQSTPPSPGGSYMCTASSGGDSLTKNVTLNRLERDTISFSPSDDILNVNEGDNVTIICWGSSSHHCTNIVGFECVDSWNTMSDGWSWETQHELNLYNINLDKTGRHYCIHEEYEQSSNTRISLYRSVQINVIASSTSTASTSTEQPTTTTQVGLILNIQLASADNIRHVSPSNKLVSSVGDIITVTCTAECSSSCSYSWLKDQQTVSTSNVLTVNTANYNGYSDAALKYSCVVTLGSVVKEKDLFIYVRPNAEQYLTISHNGVGNELTVNEGDRVEITCSSGYPTPCNLNSGYYCETQWMPYSVDTSIEPSFQFLQSEGTQTLIIPNVTKSNEKLYTCHYMETDNTVPSLGSVEMLTYTKQLNLIVQASTTSTASTTSIAATTTTSTTTATTTPTTTEQLTTTTQGSVTNLEVVSSSDPQLIQEGSDLTLTCQTDCQPADSCVYIWKFNDNIIANTPEYKIVNIARLATGSYTCSVSKGQTLSDTIDVKVNYPPSAMTITRNPDKSTYNVQSTIKLTCNVDCVPQATITWAKGTQILQVSNTVNYISLSNVLTGDSGEYTCTADNGIGNQMTATTSISIKYILYGGSGASSIHWMFFHKIILMVVIVYFLQ